MSCNCNCNCQTVRASSIALADETITITVPSTTDLTNPGCLRIGLFSTIPNTVSCANIIVTNGTDSLPVLKENGDNWRPCKLCCRSILKTQILTDPAHLLYRGTAR